MSLSTTKLILVGVILGIAVARALDALVLVP